MKLKTLANIVLEVFFIPVYSVCSLMANLHWY